MLTVIGGTYVELCREPEYEELWGSGLRGACALADKGFKIQFFSCIGKLEKPSVEHTCIAFGISPTWYMVDETVIWNYYHPLAKPTAYSSVLVKDIVNLPNIEAETILYYGMIEATVKVKGAYIVYDPQNGKNFNSTGSTAEHLAIVLNKKEALLLSGMEAEDDLVKIGKHLLSKEKAEVVIIKNGSDGGIVVDHSGISAFPIFATETVWPIGSGDIFSAAFAWKWAIEKMPPRNAAYLASQFTAQFCETKVLPLPLSPNLASAIPIKAKKNFVYLAGPFFTIAERWLINEIRNALLDFDNEVFSPLHDVGVPACKSTVEISQELASADLQALDKTNVLLAIASGNDVGTMIEIGYAIAKKKRIIVLAENLNPTDLTMLEGSNCIIVSDISSAVYKASW